MTPRTRRPILFDLSKKRIKRRHYGLDPDSTESDIKKAGGFRGVLQPPPTDKPSANAARQAYCLSRQIRIWRAGDNASGGVGSGLPSVGHVVPDVPEPAYRTQARTADARILGSFIFLFSEQTGVLRRTSANGGRVLGFTGI